MIFMARHLFDPITDNLGAYVRVTAENILDNDHPAKFIEALEQYGVLVLPEINLPDETLVELTKQLGEMVAANVTHDGSGPSKKGIYRIALDKSDKSQREYVAGNDYWHMDGTVYQVPGKTTLLTCVSPPASGGNTEFAHLFAAYEGMSEEQKKRLDGLRVVHCFEPVGRKLIPNPSEEDLDRWNAVFPHTEHPLVWRQKNGRSSLVIGTTASGIIGMPEDEGRDFLDELLDWCTQDNYTYQHSWKKGDLVIFNNPGLLHRSRPYDETAGRVLHRTTIKGVESIQ